MRWPSDGTGPCHPFARTAGRAPATRRRRHRASPARVRIRGVPASVVLRTPNTVPSTRQCSAHSRWNNSATSTTSRARAAVSAGAFGTHNSPDRGAWHLAPGGSVFVSLDTSIGHLDPIEVPGSRCCPDRGAWHLAAGTCTSLQGWAPRWHLAAGLGTSLRIEVPGTSPGRTSLQAGNVPVPARKCARKCARHLDLAPRSGNVPGTSI